MRAKAQFALGIFLLSALSFFSLKMFSQPPFLITPLSDKKTIQIVQGKKAILGQVTVQPTVASSSAMPPPTLTLIPTSPPTPTLSPTPRPTINVSYELDDLFTKYSSEHSVDKELLKRIAYCESKMNPSAINGSYVGLFQFSETSWSATRTVMGQDVNLDLRFNTEESIKTASFKIAQGGLSAWKNCSR